MPKLSQIPNFMSLTQTKNFKGLNWEIWYKKTLNCCFTIACLLSFFLFLCTEMLLQRPNQFTRAYHHKRNALMSFFTQKKPCDARTNSQISVFSMPDLNSIDEMFCVLATLLSSKAPRSWASAPKRYKIHIVHKVENVMLLKTKNG